MLPVTEIRSFWLYMLIQGWERRLGAVFIWQRLQGEIQTTAAWTAFSWRAPRWYFAVRRVVGSCMLPCWNRKHLVLLLCHLLLGPSNLVSVCSGAWVYTWHSFKDRSVIHWHLYFVYLFFIQYFVDLFYCIFFFRKKPPRAAYASVLRGVHCQRLGPLLGWWHWVMLYIIS